MIDIYDGNNIMRRAYEVKYQMPGEKVMSLRMRFEQACWAQPGSQIWVWDGQSHNERRQEIYPQYKSNRPPIAADIFAQVRLWRDLLAFTPQTQITIFGWEADDIIGSLVRRMPGKARVHTNDMDYGQIAHLCDLKGVNMKGVPPRWVPLYKAMCGDSSDNIDGIPGFGPGRWLEMAPHWAQIERAVRAGAPEGFADLPFKPKVKAWLLDPVNIKLLQSMLLVTHFHPVPEDELNGGITTGTRNPEAGHALLSRYFL